MSNRKAPVGIVLGKALGEWEDPDNGVIPVLVVVPRVGGKAGWRSPA